MDNLTHSLVSALIGQAGLKRRTGLAMPALILGANLPDVDAACFLWLDGVEHLGFRRGITHGPPALVLLPLILAGALWAWDRGQTARGTRPEARPPVRFGWLFALAFLACLTHPALDWLNVYGIRLLEPFSSRWFYGDTLFIIDVWLWLGMGLAVWLSLRRERRGGAWRTPARAALAGTVAYIALNGAISAAASEQARLHEPYPEAVVASPFPLAFWRREIIAGLPGGRFVSTAWDGPPAGHGYRQARGEHCTWPRDRSVLGERPEVRAFLLWARTPFLERAPDGSAILRDARFYNPLSRDRFSVALPEVACRPLRGEPG